jgi:hypothetical protein
MNYVECHCRIAPVIDSGLGTLLFQCFDEVGVARLRKARLVHDLVSEPDDDSIVAVVGGFS